MTIQEIEDKIKSGEYKSDILDDIELYRNLDNKILEVGKENYLELYNLFAKNNIDSIQILDANSGILFSDKYKVIRFYCGVFVYLKGERVFSIKLNKEE